MFAQSILVQSAERELPWGGEMLVLDHLAVSGETLEAAAAYVEDALGVALQAGGEHDVFQTHNQLLGLEDGLYLEAIAINPEAPVPSRPRWFDLDRFSGPAKLTNWICRTRDLPAALSSLRGDFGTAVDLQRGNLRWRMAVPQNGVLPYDNLAPALIEWRTDIHPATRLNQKGIRLERVTISHPQGADLGETLRAVLSDDRIRLETGPAGLNAEFSTPHGRRSL